MRRRDDSERLGAPRGLGEYATRLRTQLFDGASPERQGQLRAAERRSRVFAAFNAVMAGTREGAHVTGLHFIAEEAKLIVYVDGASWTQELTMLREIIRARMDAAGEAPASIVFLTSKRPATRARKKPAAPPNRLATASAPLTRDEDAAITAATGGVGDPRLREALRKAMKASFEWKKGVEGENSR